MPEFFSLDHLNRLIVSSAHKIRAIPFDLVVHLPRSGTIPASLIATYLCKPLQSVDEFCARMPVNDRKSETIGGSRILVVDDSINEGIQLKAAVDRIRLSRPDARIKTLVVYDNIAGRPDRIFDCDYRLHCHDAPPYLMPWFLWKSAGIKDAAIDMDGVLCRDCTRAEDDDGEQYQEFLRTAEVKFRPLKHKIGCIVTSRLEKYRPQTEEWLFINGFRCERLIMGPWASKAERKNAAEWKAQIYRGLPQAFFIESSDKDAQIIAKASGKLVFCIDSQKIYREE
jgi:hypothetical protein